MTKAEKTPFADLDVPDRARRIIDTAIAVAKGKHKSKLAGDVRRLHGLLTAERDQRDAGYLRDAGMRRAYLGYYAPKNAIKIAHLLQQLHREGHLPDVKRVLDLGCGPLSATMGAACVFDGLEEAVAVDLAKKSMEEGRALMRDIGIGMRPRLEVASLTAPNRWNAERGGFDLVVLANVLNEMGDPRKGIAARQEVVEAALQRLSPDGVLLIVEPATQVHSRALMRLRDELVADVDSHGADVLAPCPSGVESCPMMQGGRDWCHADLPVERTPMWTKLETEAKIGTDTLKTSFLLLGRNAPSASSGVRLVGGVMRGRGAPEGRYACSPAGLVTLQAKKGKLPAKVARPTRGAWLADVPDDVEATDSSALAREARAAAASKRKAYKGKRPAGAGQKKKPSQKGGKRRGPPR